MLARAPLGLAGAACGAGLVCVLSLTLGPPGSALGALDALQARLIAIRSPEPPKVNSASVAPFTLFGQGGAPSVLLEGVALSPGRRAALMSINGAASDWLGIGETRDGVTVVEIEPGQVVLDTDVGTKSVKLGDGVASPSMPTGRQASLGAAALLPPAAGLQLPPVPGAIRTPPLPAASRSTLLVSPRPVGPGDHSPPIGTLGARLIDAPGGNH